MSLEVEYVTLMLVLCMLILVPLIYSGNFPQISTPFLIFFLYLPLQPLAIYIIFWYLIVLLSAKDKSTFNSHMGTLSEAVVLDTLVIVITNISTFHSLNFCS